MQRRITRLDYYVGIILFAILLIAGGYGVQVVTAQGAEDKKVSSVDTLEAHEIRLLDNQNRVRLLMGVDGGNTHIAIFDTLLRPRVMMEVNSNTGRIIVGDANSKDKVLLSEEPAGSGFVAVADKSGNVHFITPSSPDKFKHNQAP